MCFYTIQINSLILKKKQIFYKFKKLNTFFSANKFTIIKVFL